MRPKTNRVDSSATMAPPPAPRPKSSSREPRLPASSGGVAGAAPLMTLSSSQRLLEEGNVLAGVDPLIEDALQRSVGLDLGDRLVHARYERIAQLEHGADL